MNYKIHRDWRPFVVKETSTTFVTFMGYLHRIYSMAHKVQP